MRWWAQGMGRADVREDLFCLKSVQRWFVNIPRVELKMTDRQLQLRLVRLLMARASGGDPSGAASASACMPSAGASDSAEKSQQQQQQQQELQQQQQDKEQVRVDTAEWACSR